MCRSPRAEDEGSGVGTNLSIARDEECDDISDVTEDLLKRKNAELHELQAQMLSVPRSERKKLKVDAEVLDAQIKKISANYAHSSEVQRAAAALNASIITNDATAIAAALERLIKMSAGLSTINEVALFYLISAIEGVVSAIKLHSSHSGVVQGGLHALCNLFAGLKLLDNGEDIARQWSTTEVGDIVIDAMSKLLEDRDVQFYGCRVINILAVNMNTGVLGVIEEDIGGDPLEASLITACFFASARVAVSKARRQHINDSEVTQWADCATRLL